MKNLITLDFRKPTPINMDDTVNLRDIYHTLVEKGGIATSIDFNKWAHRKLHYYTESVDYFRFDKNVERDIGATIRREISTTVQVAMEIVANGHKEAGHEMRRFMTECIRMSQERLASPDLSEIDILVRSVGLLARQQKEIDTLKRETPRLVKDEVQSALEDKQAFPDDCIRMGELLSRYFAGVSREKVCTFLNNIKHPRGNHVHINEGGYRTVSHPFKREGIEEAARNFFKDRIFIKETAKSIFWYHPQAGKMREGKHNEA